ncbi:hypothetical protein MVEN_01969700 [Mycena venus]|uniref:Uncharacterized protein n=1 Tax=Mycena venus TaxID=2733690 RepID=A0A8H7CJW7_9AGAR|nr:hypothetical protein MVEN_01969700 [Mycena venus]
MGIRDRRCSRRSPSPSLAELERGQGQALKGKATSATEPPPRSSEPPTIHLSWRVTLLSVFERLTLLVFHAISLLGVLFHGKVVSLQEPLIDNIAAALLFVLWGLQVLFVALLLVLLIAWLAGVTSLSTAEGEVERACRNAVDVRSEPSFDVEKYQNRPGRD